MADRSRQPSVSIRATTYAAIAAEAARRGMGPSALVTEIVGQALDAVAPGLVCDDCDTRWIVSPERAGEHCRHRYVTGCSGILRAVQS